MFRNIFKTVLSVFSPSNRISERDQKKITTETLESKPLTTNMKVMNVLVGLFAMIMGVMALADQGDGLDPTTSKSATTVWVTLTINGKLTTLPSSYSQTFLSTPTTADTSGLSSGSVGLGTLSGSVGLVRSYTLTTINGGVALGDSMYAGMTGMCFMLIGALM